MPLLEARGISKAFGSTKALDDVSLTVEPGEIRAIVGENGSGKSTLMRVLSGEVAPDGGTVLVDGRELARGDARERRAAGLGVVFQEPRLALERTVADNLLMGRVPSRFGVVDRAALRRAAQAMLDRAGVELPLEARVATLSQDERQLTETARVLGAGTRVIGLDETTASLTADHVQRLFAAMRRRRDDGAALLFITHRLHEIFDVCDSVTVMRDGIVTGTRRIDEVDEDAIVRLMVGRSLDGQYRRPRSPKGPLVLRASGLRPEGFHGSVDLELHAGEVVGVAGLLGSGRTELLEAIFGLRRREGEVTVHDRRVRAGDPRRAIAAGMAFIPEDRRRLGLALHQSVRGNASWVDTGARPLASRLGAAHQRRLVQRIRDHLSLKAPDDRAPIWTLSGGNQQKVVLGRWLDRDVSVLLLDEPTRAIDVLTKREVYDLVHRLAGRGAAVLVVSSELPELLGLCDRILTLRERLVVAEFGGEASEELIAAAMAGADARP